jgi:short subunit dehydrogenase-like uncharacterized protein
MKNKWIIYGSYGYTGQLIAEIASKSDKEVILSGRDEHKLRQQADILQLSYLKADLDNAQEMSALLKDAILVIHCAGPFRHTYRKMAKACLEHQCHYLDITGEIEVFEGMKAYGEKFEKAGIMAMPGTGFDVVPSDCLAAYLHQQLPDATDLELAFMGLGGGLSHGTATTMAENIDKGGAIRKNGKIEVVPTAYKDKKIDFGRGYMSAMTIPWGDVSTAYHSTGIPNIMVYMAAPPKAIAWAKRSNHMGFILKTNLAKSLLKKYINSRPAGPDIQARQKGKSLLWGKVTNAAGKNVEARLQTKEGYTLTALTAWLIAEKVASGNFKTGYQTPSSAYGADLIMEIAGTERQLL